MTRRPASQARQASIRSSADSSTSRGTFASNPRELTPTSSASSLAPGSIARPRKLVQLCRNSSTSSEPRPRSIRSTLRLTKRSQLYRGRLTLQRESLQRYFVVLLAVKLSGCGCGRRSERTPPPLQRAGVEVDRKPVQSMGAGGANESHQLVAQRDPLGQVHAHRSPSVFTQAPHANSLRGGIGGRLPACSHGNIVGEQRTGRRRREVRRRGSRRPAPGRGGSRA